MSTSLKWEEVPKHEVDSDCISALKHIFAKRYNGDTFSYDYGHFDKTDIPYLNGLADSGDQYISEAATNLINAINKYNRVRVFCG